MRYTKRVIHKDEEDGRTINGLLLSSNNSREETGYEAKCTVGKMLIFESLTFHQKNAFKNFWTRIDLSLQLRKFVQNLLSLTTIRLNLVSEIFCTKLTYCVAQLSAGK